VNSTRKEHLLTTDNSQTEAKSQASSLLSLSFTNTFPGCALLASGHALTEAKLHYNFVNRASIYKEYRALTFLDTIYARGQTKEVRLCESR
jgi:hypothetical protein